jgi:hypothetical protein
MTRLNRITIDRLKRLPRVASVWEGDRRSVGGLMDDDGGLRQRHTETSDCILWLTATTARCGADHCAHHLRLRAGGAHAAPGD